MHKILMCFQCASVHPDIIHRVTIEGAARTTLCGICPQCGKKKVLDRYNIMAPIPDEEFRGTEDDF